MRREIFFTNDTLDLACTEQPCMLRTTAGFTGADKRAAVIVAVLVGNCVTTSVVSNAHQDLRRVDLGRPEATQRSVNFSKISLRLDTLGRSVP